MDGASRRDDETKGNGIDEMLSYTAVRRTNLQCRVGGKRMDVTAMSLARFANGKVVEDWMNMDELRMMTQLGLLPSGQSTSPDRQRR